MQERSAKSTLTWAENDYRFAWRVMLPSHGIRTFGIFGFDDADRSFWRIAMSQYDLVPSGEAGDISVIDADHFMGKSDEVADEFGGAQAICIVGSGSRVIRWKQLVNKSYAHCREYALLPASEPRVLVPLSTRRHILEGLRIHRPGRLEARVALFIVTFFARIGSYVLLRRRVLLIATRHSAAEFAEIGGMVVGTKSQVRPSNYALYFGAPKRDRKFVALPLSEREPETILKIAESAGGRKSLLRESNALMELQATSIARYVPKLIELRNEKGLSILRQEYRARRYVRKRQLDNEVTRFLVNISAVGQRWSSLKGELDVLQKKSNAINSTNRMEGLERVLGALDSASQQGVKMCSHWTHGDFAPWNICWSRTGLFVFDWEESQRSDVALTDAFYYAMAPLIHIGRRPNTARILHNALQFSVRVASEAGLRGIDVHVHFAVFALRRIQSDPIYASLLRVLAHDYLRY